jgi:ATP-dependent Clp protease ATP-binding subunit ClpC
LFIDEIHNLIGLGGNGDGSMNAANLLKPALARGELRVLGATTTPEYRRYIEKDGALERRFQPLEVKEPTWEETVQILSAVMPKYEEYHGVEFTSNALVAAAKLSDRYINDRFLPDKAIDLLDEAASMVKMAEEGESFFVTEDAISEVISQISGIPIGKLDTGEKTRLSRLESELEERIKGQEVAVRAVAKSIRRARSGMRDGKRPVASLLFCGPTGVGKVRNDHCDCFKFDCVVVVASETVSFWPLLTQTGFITSIYVSTTSFPHTLQTQTELCKALASTYYGQEKDMIRIDMSEYMDRFSTSRLVGAPPGYVGYDEGGQLTEAVRRSPHSVVLFDELEKAHEDVLNILLQIMDEGVLTDGKGRKVNFKNTIFVMTSNIGSKDILAAARDAKINVGDAAQVTSDVVKAALEEAMKPELLNRIDEIVVFSPLSYDNLKDIATNLIADAVKRTAADLKIKMTVSDNLPEIITRETMQVASLYGARPTRRAVQRYLEDPMAEVIMSGFIDEGDEVKVNLKDPNSEKRVIQITRVLDGKIKLVDIDEDAGIKSSIDEDLDYQATYGDLPPLGGPPKRGTDSFQ